MASSPRRRRKNPSSSELRRLLPDVALKMETQVLVDAARQIGLVCNSSCTDRNAKIEIKLRGRYVMTVSPIDVGANKTREWMTFIPPHECPDDHPEYSIRMAVEIEYTSRAGEYSKEVFTVGGVGFLEALDNAFSSYNSITGRSPQPAFGTRRYR
jgi:hypothetical protein